MTAMKKSNTKTKSPAPATSVAKSATSVAKTTKKKSVAAAETNGVSATAPLTVAPVQTTAPTKPASASKPAPTANGKTKIIARADVGYGNALYVRGEGPGLSWNHGIPMKCITNDQWELDITEASRPVSFKVLLNDATWCTGPDNTVDSGATATVSPEFV